VTAPAQEPCMTNPGKKTAALVGIIKQLYLVRRIHFLLVPNRPVL